MWFEKLTGFREESPEQVRKNISVNWGILKSNVNKREFVYGILETPSLEELRNRTRELSLPSGTNTIREIIADVKELHADKQNARSLFQVASQFNLLEMASPNIKPEDGVDIYDRDHTQGPACAIAAGAGTIYRNYFIDVNGRKGQTADHQIDCLHDIGKALGNEKNCLWLMKNGYALATSEGLQKISNKLKNMDTIEKDKLMGLLRIGIQWNTEVTIAKTRHTVTQAYCSALPVAYSHQTTDLWSEFAQLILKASYEATLLTGMLNFYKTGNNKIFLTLVGGGVFGNKLSWIINAIKNALNKYNNSGLNVIIVSHNRSNEQVQELIREFK